MATSPLALKARVCVEAISADDAVALHDAWVSLPQNLAESLLLQAWRMDKTNNRQAAFMSHGGLVSAIYVAVSKIEVEMAINNASMLLFSAALKNDDPELFATMLLWDEGFHIVSPEPDTEGMVVASNDEVLHILEASSAPRCAEFWNFWTEGRRAPIADASLGTVSIHERLPPAELVPEVGSKRLSVVTKQTFFERNPTLCRNVTKMVMLVEFGASHTPSTSSGLKEMAGRRQKATEAMHARGWRLLEACNMRAAFYDHGAKNKAFHEAATSAAAKSGLHVVSAERTVDPGIGLMTFDKEAFFFF